MLRLIPLALLLAVLALAGCGGDEDEAAPPAATTAQEEQLKIGLITDQGQLDDNGFNELAFRGLKRAEQELGVKGRVVESASAADYIPNMTALARQDYDLIVGVGFAQGDAIGKVAQRFPDVNFAIIDVDQAFVPGKPANVQGLLFREQEVGYLVGYLAGLEEKRRAGADAISAVGGFKEPPVDRFIAGYFAGAEKAAPGITTMHDYSQDWEDQAKCKELALNQIARGSNVVFQVAGGCGLGALNAAEERDRWGIGVDADQSSLGAARPDERAEGRRRGGLPHDQGGPGRLLAGRRQRHLRAQGGWGRARDGQPRGAAGGRRPGRRDRAADRRRRDRRHSHRARQELTRVVLRGRVRGQTQTRPRQTCRGQDPSRPVRPPAIAATRRTREGA